MTQKEKLPITEDLEQYVCSKCFYCVDVDIDAETFYCTKIGKTINDFAYKSEFCENFFDYWEAYKIVEKRHD